MSAAKRKPTAGEWVLWRLTGWRRGGVEYRGGVGAHTIEEWGERTGIYVLDPDGFDRSDPKLRRRKFSRVEFEAGALLSTAKWPRRGKEETIDLGGVPEKVLLFELGRRYEAGRWEEIGGLLGRLLMEICGKAFISSALPAEGGERPEVWAWPKIEAGLREGVLTHRPLRGRTGESGQ